MIDFSLLPHCPSASISKSLLTKGAFNAPYNGSFLSSFHLWNSYIHWFLQIHMRGFSFRMLIIIINLSLDITSDSESYPPTQISMMASWNAILFNNTRKWAWIVWVRSIINILRQWLNVKIKIFTFSCEICFIYISNNYRVLNNYNISWSTTCINQMC